MSFISVCNMQVRRIAFLCKCHDHVKKLGDGKYLIFGKVVQIRVSVHCVKHRGIFFYTWVCKPSICFCYSCYRSSDDVFIFAPSINKNFLKHEKRSCKCYCNNIPYRMMYTCRFMILHIMLTSIILSLWLYSHLLQKLHVYD